MQQEPRVIRKYGNRRLYDTSAKRYVNLEEIAQMIRDGAEVQVRDAKSGEDLTRGILTQIIMEDSKRRNGGLPLEILRELIALSDKAKHEGLMLYLRTAFETYRRAQHAAGRVHAKPLHAPARMRERPQMEDLRQRVEELERLLAAKEPTDRQAAANCSCSVEPVERRGRSETARDSIRHFIEVAGADESLMPDGGVPGFLGEQELALLKAGVGGHTGRRVAARQLEHAEVQGVEAG